MKKQRRRSSKTASPACYCVENAPRAPEGNRAYFCSKGKKQALQFKKKYGGRVRRLTLACVWRRIVSGSRFVNRRWDNKRHRLQYLR